MKKINSKFLISLSTIIIAVVWIYLGVTKYGLWDAKDGPKSGLFPVMVACILLISGLVSMWQNRKAAPTEYGKPALYVIGGMLAVLIGGYIIGFLPMLLVFYVAWLRFIEKFPWKTIAIATVFMTVLVYGTFVLWLGVPFPKGLIYDLIMY